VGQDSCHSAYKRAHKDLVRPEGIEPPTLWSEARCSDPLSYGRICHVRIPPHQETGRGERI
jgi:hypothetical protein